MLSHCDKVGIEAKKSGLVSKQKEFWWGCKKYDLHEVISDTRGLNASYFGRRMNPSFSKDERDFVIAENR